MDSAGEEPQGHVVVLPHSQHMKSEQNLKNRSFAKHELTKAISNFDVTKIQIVSTDRRHEAE